MTFTHPLARKSKVWPLGTVGTKPRNALVIITTLNLDPSSKKYKADNVTRLSDAATEWLSFHQDTASEFVLVNRTKDW